MFYSFGLNKVNVVLEILIELNSSNQIEFRVKAW
jgi:hypothetical protein